MPVYSMTGYASAQKSTAQAARNAEAPAAAVSRLGLEIRSVNRRFLDLSFRLSDELRQHEPALRELLGSQLAQGATDSIVRSLRSAPIAGQLQYYSCSGAARNNAGRTNQHLADLANSNSFICEAI